MNSDINKLQTTLLDISNELISAADIDDVFWQVQAIIRNNPQINVRNVFQDWIAKTYVDSIAIRIRRLVDTGKDTISLWRLLEEMKHHASRFTRTWYLSRHSSEKHPLLNSWFDDIAGKGARSVSRKQIVSQQKELTKTTKLVVDYANSNIAHYAKNQKKKRTPTFSDARRALVSIFKIFRWCDLIITPGKSSSPVPVNQTNWVSVFNIPWLEEGAGPPPYKHLDEIIKEK